MNSNSDTLDLVIPQDCDNAPRKQMLINFIVGVLTNEPLKFQSSLHESIHWHLLAYKKVLKGQNESIEWIQSKHKHLSRLEIYQVITHGKFASVNGVITLKQGGHIEFCYVIRFNTAAKSGKIVEVRSYEI